MDLCSIFLIKEIDEDNWELGREYHYGNSIDFYVHFYLCVMKIFVTCHKKCSDSF
jgi:hypothetical protein